MIPESTTAGQLETWASFLRAHSAITRRMDADLAREHGLTLSDYEVLLQLARAPEHHMSMSRLAERVLLTRSGITRLVNGLCDAGLVTRVSCPSDARVCYAQLTPAGHEMFAKARTTHIEGVRTMFLDRFGEDDLDRLGDLLGRLPQRPEECAGAAGTTIGDDA